MQVIVTTIVSSALLFFFLFVDFVHQDFWNCYNNLPPVEKLKPKSSYHLMKAGVRPLWEDPENERGGFWVLRIRKEDTYLSTNNTKGEGTNIFFFFFFFLEPIT